MAAGTQRLLRFGAAVLVLAACGDVDPDEEQGFGDPEDVGEASQALRSDNALSANALTDNALGNNALGNNALGNNALGNNALGNNALGNNALAMSALNDPAPSGDPTFPTKGQLTEELLRYIYKCALPSSSTMTLSLDRGEVQFKGEIGVAPQWETGTCDSTCEHWVSACVLARLNGYGVPIKISMRGNSPALATTPAEEAEFTLYEARFWGNIFRDELQSNHMACQGPGATLGHLTSRVCASTGGNCTLDIAGECSASCDVNGDCAATTALGVPTSVPSIGVWLRAPTPEMCGDGTCQAGETGASCAFDCPATATVVDHETSGYHATSRAVAGLGTNTMVYAGITDAPTLAGLGALNPTQASSRDVFVIKANADGTYAAAKRFAAGTEEIVGLSTDGANNVVLATQTALRTLSATTLNVALSWSTAGATSRFRLESVRIDAAGIHTTGTYETLSGSVWTVAARQYRLYDLTSGNEVSTKRREWTTVSAPWVQWAADSCAGAAARKASASQVEVKGIKLSSTGTCMAADWTQTLTVPGVADPTPVAVRHGGFVAGTSGNGTASFLGRAQPGVGAWVWLNRLTPPDATRSVTITSMEVAGQLVIVAGRFKGPIDFRGSIRSLSQGKRPGVNANEDGFVAAYEQESGALRWVRSYGGPGVDAIDAFAFDATRRLWAVGRFVGRSLLDGQLAQAVGGDLDTDSIRVIVGPLPLGASSSVGVGKYHSLSLRDNGTVWSWGQNNYGQLGDGTITDRSAPVQVSGLLGIEAIAASASHSLALKADGTLWAWGSNMDGQLGDGTMADRRTPVQVVGLQGVVTAAGGEEHSLALKADGTVWAWGYNQQGQLGDGTTTTRHTPVQVVGLQNVVAMAANRYHSLAATTDGTVWAWGYNKDGQLGDGTTTTRHTPVQVVGLQGVIAVSCGDYHSLALKADGTVWAWGSNTDGQLGDGTTTKRLTPVQVAGLQGGVAVSAGDFHSQVLKADGTVWSWGNNLDGQLCDGTTTKRLTPVQSVGLQGIVAIKGGNLHAVAQKADGTVWAWGYDREGQLGDGISSPTNRLWSSRVRGAFEVTQGSAWEHGAAVMSDGTVSSWGRGDFGALGDGSTQTRLYAAPVLGLSNAGSVVTGESFTVVRRKDGSVWTWGKNSSGQLGDGSLVDRGTAAPVAGLTGVGAVVAGKAHAYVLKAGGTVWAWGDNSSGQLGDGTTTTRTTPVQVSGLSDVAAVAAGFRFGLAVKQDGTLWAWGDNSSGQLGDGTTTNRLTPVQVGGLVRVVRFAGGAQHSVTVTSDGTVWTWGANAYGALGDGTTTNRLTPTPVPGLAGVVHVGAGDSYTVALKSDGRVWSFGKNTSGQLGDGTTTARTSPVQVPNLTNASDLVARSASTLVIKTDGTVWTWGANAYGQLGDRSTTAQTSPVQAFDL